jgi:hypothetical protein
MIACLSCIASAVRAAAADRARTRVPDSAATSKFIRSTG